MRIERNELINNLVDFVSSNSGIVSGAPGIGKTYSLECVRDALLNKDVPTIIIPIDNYLSGDSDEIKKELEIEVDLLSHLLSFENGNLKHGVVIFDGYDSARDDFVRNNFLVLIKELLTKLNVWNVIVSIRQFDADRNKALLEEFPHREDHSFSNANLSCQNFFIPELRDTEVEAAVSLFSSTSLVIYNGLSQKFKEILKTPFYLWLLEQVIQSSDATQLSSIRSEVQLLDLFWKMRIIGKNSKELFLSKLILLMVKARKLSLNISSLDFKYDESDWKELLQNEIIKETSLFKNRIAFSHNVLFDYAVARYSLPHNADEFLKFFTHNEGASIFLRPSIQYYFNSLWWFERVDFWRNLGVFLSSEEPSIGIMAKTIPFAVILEETQDIDDVKPILDIKIDVRIDALRFLLFGMNTLKIENKLLVAQIYNMVSGAISREYAWNLGTGIKDLTDSSSDKDILLICHEVSHRLYNWIETHENTPWGKTLSSNWCLPVILKTAENDLEATEKIVLNILSLIGSENFDIKMIYRLVQDIDPIFDLAPELASKIYTHIFSYEENSKDVVSFGTPVMPLTSNRRQDYQMCFYLLNQKFDKFLKAAPIAAVKSAIICAESEVRRKHIENKDSVESVETKFLSTSITIDLDYSYIWNQGRHHDDKAIELVIKATNELSRLLDESNVNLETFLSCWVSNAKVAFSWKQLLELGCNNPDKLKDHLLSFSLTPEILLSSEFEYDIGKYLKAVYSYLSDGQRQKVENILMNLPKFAKNQDHIVYAERDRDRFISNVASDLLVTDEAKKHFKKLEDANDLIPLEKNYSIETRWGKYTDEEYYSDEGIDLKEEANQKLFSAKKKISSFKEEVLSENFEIEAKEEEVKSLLEENYKLYRNNLTSKLSSDLLTELCSFIDAIAFKIKSQDAPLFSLSKEILLLACKHEKPVFNTEYHSKFDSPGWSPSPRSEGVQGILKLSIRGKDDEIINVVRTLVSDPVPAIRYLTGTELFRLFWCDEDSFFEISGNMAKTESNGTVLGGLLNSLRRICSKDTDKVADILQSIPSGNLSDDSRDLFINTVTWYLLDSKKTHQWAVDYFDSLKADLAANHSYLRNLTLSLCNYLEYKSMLDNEANFELAKKYLLDLINSSESTLVELLKVRDEKKDEQWQKKVHDIYEVIGETITRLYFSFDFKEDNRRFKDVEIPDIQSRYKYYKAIEPLFSRVSDYCENESVGLMFAPTAHYFMQLMNIVVEFNPKSVLQFSRKLVQASTKYNYNLDHMAVNEVVKLVDKLLINHKHEIQDQESIFNLIFLLDTFADVGWPEALKRVWKLDEIFR